MPDFNSPASHLNITVIDITPNDLAGANSGQRNDLVSMDRVLYRVSGLYYNSNGVTLVAATIFSPRILAQAAIPVILAPNGTVATNGTITLGTALSTTYANAWVRLPAGAVVGGLAGLYYATFSSTTVGVVSTTFVDAAQAFTPYIPIGTVAAVGSNAAYTQTTATDITLANITVPGGMMGANGVLRDNPLVHFGGVTGARIIRSKLGSVTYRDTSVSTTNAVVAAFMRLVRNRGVQTSQVMSSPFGGEQTSFAGSIPTLGAINTAVDQPLTFIGQIAVATDYIVLEGFTVEVLPG